MPQCLEALSLQALRSSTSKSTSEGARYASSSSRRKVNKIMAQQTNIAEQVGMLWDYTTNRGLTFLTNSSQVPTLRALLEGEKLEDQPTFEWLKENDEEKQAESNSPTI